MEEKRNITQEKFYFNRFITEIEMQAENCKLNDEERTQHSKRTLEKDITMV